MNIWTVVRGISVAAIIVLAAGCQPTTKPAASPVDAHIKKAFPNADIVSTKSKLKHLTKVYEAKLKEGGKETEVTLSSDGVILKIETEVNIGDLPKPVADAVAKLTQGAKGVEVEKIERKGTLKGNKAVSLDAPEVYYEVEYSKMYIKREVKLAADGSRRTHSKPKT